MTSALRPAGGGFDHRDVCGQSKAHAGAALRGAGGRDRRGHLRQDGAVSSSTGSTLAAPLQHDLVATPSSNTISLSGCIARERLAMHSSRTPR